MNSIKKENICCCLDRLILILMSVANVLGCVILPKLYGLGVEVFDDVVMTLYAAQLLLLLEMLRVKSRDHSAEKGAVKALGIITPYICFFAVSLMVNVDVYLFFSGITVS